MSLRLPDFKNAKKIIGNFGGKERADGLAYGTVQLVNEYLG